MDRTALLNTVDNCLFQFFTQVEKEFHLPENILRQRWMGEQSSPPPEKKKASSSLKKSNYQNFFSIQRKLIMQKDNTLSFGDISKMISAMWKVLPAEKKLTYTEDRVAETMNEPPKTTVEDESVKIIHTQKKKSKTGRSKLELSIDETEKDKDEDEEDFYFQDDMDDGSIIDADDDGEIEDEEEDGLYDDDD